MNRTKKLLSVILPILFLIASAARAEKAPIPAGPASGAVTVGEFAMKVAGLALDSPADRESLTPQSALESLGRAGLRFGSSHDAGLTEADLSGFFRYLSECLVKPTVGECRACCLALPGIETPSSCGRVCGQARAGKIVTPTDPQP